MKPYWQDEQVTLYRGQSLDVLRELPDGSAACCVTSPPYYRQRDYGDAGQIGLEASPDAYVERLLDVFSEVRRVLADDGLLWLNVADCYSGSWGNQSRKPGRGTQRPVNGPMLQPVHDERYPAQETGTGAIRPGEPPAKNLMGLPWKVAFALQQDGWIWRNVIPWHKPNAMPHPVDDRLVSKWEPLLLMAKSPRYQFGLDAIREPHTMRPQRRPNGHKSRQALGVLPAQTHSTSQRDEPGTDGHPLGRNPGDVWEIGHDPFDEIWRIPTVPFTDAHFATFPVQLPIRCVKTTRPGATVLDPFSGAGTTGEACRRLGRRYVGIDLNPAYHDLAVKRYAQGVLEFGEVS